MPPPGPSCTKSPACNPASTSPAVVPYRAAVSARPEAVGARPVVLSLLYPLVAALAKLLASRSSDARRERKPLAAATVSGSIRSSPRGRATSWPKNHFAETLEKPLKAADVPDIGGVCSVHFLLQ